jgi:crotonobetainyl-CoA:carnitine CoA-transferase CaiB-like acyl-CoA transferase
MIEERFSRRPASDWLAALAAAGIPAGPVRAVSEALRSPEAAERGMVVRVDDVSMIAPVPKLARTPARAGSMPPRLGEHTDEVLREWLGYPPARVLALKASGAIA